MGAPPPPKPEPDGVISTRCSLHGGPDELPELLGVIIFKLLEDEIDRDILKALLITAMKGLKTINPPLHTSDYTISSPEYFEAALRPALEKEAKRLDLDFFDFYIEHLGFREAVFLGHEAIHGDDVSDARTDLPDEIRTRHVYITGKTQSGKSSLMFNLIMGDLSHERGVGVIDPHGDLVEKVVKHLPGRAEDLIYLDAQHPIPIDFMTYTGEAEQEALVGDTIFHLQRFAGWGPRMDSILRNLLYTLLEAGDVNFLDIYYFLVDKKRRDEILTRVHDYDLLRYWRETFPKQDALEPILSRMTAFVRSPSLRIFLGGGKKQLNIYDLMQEGKILLVNLVGFGRESGDLFGSLLVAKIQQAAISRGLRIPKKDDRRLFLLYADEFQRFQTPAFANILSEAGKFMLGLVMANQYVDQLDASILSAVTGNVSTFILFRMDEKDAKRFFQEPAHYENKILEQWLPQVPSLRYLREFPVKPEDLKKLPPGTFFYIKRAVDKYACHTEPNMVQSKHGDEDDDITPTGRPTDIPSNQD